MASIFPRTPDAKGRSEIHFYAFATGRATKILTIERSIGGKIAVSPGGSSIFYPPCEGNRKTPIPVAKSLVMKNAADLDFGVNCGVRAKTRRNWCAYRMNLLQEENEQDEQIAHPGNGINTSRSTAFRPIWQFAIDRFGESSKV